MLFGQEKQSKAIYDLYTFSSNYELNVAEISENDKQILSNISSSISKIVFRLNFYHKTHFSIDIIDVQDSQSNTLSSLFTQVETSLYQTEFLNDKVEETSETVRYICNELIKRNLI